MGAMWFLISCMSGVGSTMCTPPQEMPSEQVCQRVGAELKKAMIGGGKRVVCVNGDTGQTVQVRESDGS